MRISHSHKFVFIAIPKTGSSTVRQLLDSFSDVQSTQSGGRPGQFDHHITAGGLKSVFDRNRRQIFRKSSWKWREYFKFAFVRHPALRLRSSYYYQIQIGSQPPDDNLRKNDIKFYNRCNKLYESGLSLDDAVVSGSIHLKPMHYWTHDSQGSLLLDYVGKLETLSSDLSIISDSIGLELGQIPVINKSKKPGYEQCQSSFFSSEAYAQIQRTYSKDFGLFEYE